MNYNFSKQVEQLDTLIVNFGFFKNREAANYLHDLKHNPSERRKISSIYKRYFPGKTFKNRTELKEAIKALPKDRRNALMKDLSGKLPSKLKQILSGFGWATVLSLAGATLWYGNDLYQDAMENLKDAEIKDNLTDSGLTKSLYDAIPPEELSGEMYEEASKAGGY